MNRKTEKFLIETQGLAGVGSLLADWYPSGDRNLGLPPVDAKHMVISENRRGVATLNADESQYLSQRHLHLIRG